MIRPGWRGLAILQYHATEISRRAWAANNDREPRSNLLLESLVWIVKDYYDESVMHWDVTAGPGAFVRRNIEENRAAWEAATVRLQEELARSNEKILETEEELAAELQLNATKTNVVKSLQRQLADLWKKSKASSDLSTTETEPKHQQHLFSPRLQVLGHLVIRELIFNLDSFAESVTTLGIGYMEERYKGYTRQKRAVIFEANFSRLTDEERQTCLNCMLVSTAWERRVREAIAMVPFPIAIKV